MYQSLQSYLNQVLQDELYQKVIIGIAAAVIIALIKFFWSSIVNIFSIFLKPQKTKTLNEMLLEFDVKDRDYGDNIVRTLRIEDTLNDHFPDYKDYILIQYGSSVKSNATLPSDFDFIVLMLGFPKDDKRAMHNKGTLPQADEKNSEDVDIVFRDYLSFMFAASSGMPYENSIIKEGKLIKGNSGYFKWLKNITRNQLFDREFLVRCFENKISVEKAEYQKCKREHDKFEHDIYYVIRSGYYLISSLLQLRRIKSMPKIIFQNQVVELSKIGTFYNDISDEDVRNKFKNIVELLKRNKSVDGFNKNDIEAILKYIDESDRNNVI